MKANRARWTRLRRLPVSPAPWPAIVLLAVTACGEGTTQPEPPSNDPAQIEILQDDMRVLVGNQRALSAEVRNALGTVLSSETPQWVSSSSAVATVDYQGVVRAVGGGQVRIFATAGAVLDSVQVTVPEPLGSVESPGGVVVTADAVVRLDVPEFALPSGAVISIAAADADSLPDPSIALAGTVFEFAPAGLVFQQPATLTIRYEGVVTNALEAKRLRLHRLTDAAWVPVVGSTVDTATAEVTGQITSFSIYGIAPIPNQAPVATISSPGDTSTVASGTAVTFAGAGLDDEEGQLTGASLTWESSLDGALGTGATVVRSDLSIGAHVVSLTASDSEGASNVAQIAITIIDGPPVVQISQPSVDTVAKVGEAVVFMGSATDHVDGDTPGDSLFWASSLDGALGAGDSIQTSSLSLGDHVVTLTATDSQGESGVASVTVRVQANAPPVVTITNPGEGGSVGDRSGTTFRGTADDPEDGSLSGAALVWTSSLDGPLGTGTDVGRAGLTIGVHVVTLTATDSDGATGSANVTFTVYDEPPPLLFPRLVYVGEAAGTLMLSVSNSASYDPELFVLNAALPPCGADPNGGRTWVEVFDGSGTKLATFCDFDDRADMASFSFTPAIPPAQVYVELWDREANRRVRSGSVVPTPSAPTVIAGVVANDRDVDLNTLDPGEALSGVAIQLIVDTNADGVIDAGEVTWATTTTDGSGAYSFTGLWQRNYIVRAVSPSKATVLRALSPTGSVTDQTGTLLTTGVAGGGATLNQSGTSQVGTTDPPNQGDELPRWGYTLGTAAPDTGLEPSGPGPNFLNGALTTAPTHFIFLYNTGSVSGAVKAAGVGVAGALVTVTRCQTAPAAPSPPAAGACTLKHGVPSKHITNVDTDASGNYSVSNLLEGVYQIEVAPITAGYSSVVVPGGAGFYLAVLRGDGDNAVVPDFSIN